MTNWPVLDVAIGLTFVYFLLSLVCSSANETIATIIRLRAHTLERWMEGVLVDPRHLSSIRDQLEGVLSDARAPITFQREIRKIFDSTSATIESAKADLARLISEVNISPGLAAELNSAMQRASSVEALAQSVKAALAAAGGFEAAKTQLTQLLKGTPLASLITSVERAATFEELAIVLQKVSQPTVGDLHRYRQAALARFYDDPLVRALIKQPKWTTKHQGRRPSYIPASTAIGAFLNQASDGKVDSALFNRVVENLPPQLQAVADNYAAEIGGDVEKLRAKLEGFFDDAMQRVSGWYKRRVQFILAILAMVVAGGLNADSIAIAQSLWTDPTVRTVVVAQATSTVVNNPSKPPVPKALASQLKDVHAFDLPLGWKRDKTKKGHPFLPTNAGAWAAKLAGLVLTAFALLLGAPFWFDLLSQFVRVRGGGQTPAPSPTTMGTASP